MVGRSSAYETNAVDLLLEIGITQTQLAERLGVSQQTIEAYESGKRRIQVAALPELAPAAFDHTRRTVLSAAGNHCA
jgi:transcriptional regulator with XRE-family HTH domain